MTTTTHMKWGWIRRNGVPASDQATVTTFYTRNGDVLTVTWMVHDPLYLTETYTKVGGLYQRAASQRRAVRRRPPPDRPVELSSNVSR